MLPSVAANTQAKNRFLREARVAAAIEHDHVVPIYQVEQSSIGIAHLSPRAVTSSQSPYPARDSDAQDDQRPAKAEVTDAFTAEMARTVLNLRVDDET